MICTACALNYKTYMEADITSRPHRRKHIEGFYGVLSEEEVETRLSVQE